MPNMFLKHIQRISRMHTINLGKQKLKIHKAPIRLIKQNFDTIHPIKLGKLRLLKHVICRKHNDKYL
jgi:hypothetical protein